MNVLRLIPHVQETGGKKISRQKTYISGVSLAVSRVGGEEGEERGVTELKSSPMKLKEKKKVGEE